MENQKLFYVVATAIVIKEGKYLIVKRSENEKTFPGVWTVPGGKLESDEFMKRPKDSKELWYNVMENLVRREVKEEVNLEIGTIDYATSISYLHPNGTPCILLSFFAPYLSGEVKLEDSLVEFAWVTVDEAKQYELIDGIWDELEMVDSFYKTGVKKEWKR